MFSITSGKAICPGYCYLNEDGALLPSGFMLEDRLSFENYHGKHCAHWYYDLGKKIFHIHCRDRRGKAVYRKKFTRPKLIEFLWRHALATTITNGSLWRFHFMASQVEELGHSPKLISPQFVRPGYLKAIKTTLSTPKLFGSCIASGYAFYCSPERNLSRQCGLRIVSVNPSFRIR